jgi:hypothetical protein
MTSAVLDVAPDPGALALPRAQPTVNRRSGPDA